ncbi:beta-microseminoprotein-like [Dendrobates tinctorius]|uniref:beta-microseminoprotein-like n=1 Tax=Dendrobates tinctorius TaxID=92724 RepID=UPI003CC97846
MPLYRPGEDMVPGIRKCNKCIPFQCIFQKCLVALLLCAGVFIALSDASCYSAQPQAGNEGETLKGCVHDGKLYEGGAKWRDDDCLDCSCRENGEKMCCTSYDRPTQYDEEKCTLKFNKETCNYEVISKEDPEKRCMTFGSVG